MGAKAIDAALRRLGLCGFFPLGIYFLCWAPQTPQSWQLMAASYSSVEAGFRCPNDSTGGNDSAFARTDEEIVEMCRRGCNTSWEFDQSAGSSIVAEWQLVCEREYLANLGNTGFMIGVMAGCLVTGWIADYFGRRRTVIGMLVLVSLVGANSLWVSSPTLFIIMRFFCGIPYIGIDPNYTYVTELFSSDHRLLMMALFPGWSLGMATSSLVAWAMSHYGASWRILYLVYSLSGIIVIPFLAFLPNSVYYSVRRGRHEDAKRVLQKAAKARGFQFGAELDRIHYEHDDNDDDRRDDEDENDNTNNDDDNDGGKGGNGESLLKLNEREREEERSGRMARWKPWLAKRKVYFISIFCGSLLYLYNATVYFGLSFNFQTYEGNKYLNSLFMALIEIPAMWIAIPLMIFPTRRVTVFSLVSLVAASFGTVAILRATYGQEFHNLGHVRFGIGLVSKFAISASFIINMTLLQELFPTSVRNRSIYLCCFISRFGSIAGTFMSLVNRQNPLYVEVFLCVFGLVAAIGVTMLPETKGQPLPQTMEDLNRMKRETKPFVKDCRCSVK